MKKPYAVAIVVGASIGSGLLGWLVLRPREPGDLVERVYGRQAGRYGVDKSWWIKVGYTIQKATQGRCTEITASDYEDLDRAVGSGIPDVQRPAMMAIGCCPPPDRATCYAKLDALARSTKDGTIQEWAFCAMWSVEPRRHDEIRREAAASKFPDVGDEVAHWPEKLGKG